MFHLAVKDNEASPVAVFQSSSGLHSPTVKALMASQAVALGPSGAVAARAMIYKLSIYHSIYQKQLGSQMGVCVGKPVRSEKPRSNKLTLLFGWRPIRSCVLKPKGITKLKSYQFINR